MKKSILLLAILAGILGLAYYKSNDRKGRLNSSVSSAKTRELLFPDFDINGITKLRIKEDKQDTTIEVKGDQWVVAERGGYPANKEKLQEVLMSLKYEPIKAGRRIGKDSWGKIGVNSPGDATAFGVGTLVELFDAAGTVKHSFVLGGSVTSSGGGNENPMSMFGGGGQGNRFIRIKDQDTIWEVANKFEGLVNKPADWVLKDFIAIAKIKDITVTAPKAEDSWKASRKAEADTEFTLEGAKPGESIDSTKADVASLLSSPQPFTDVLAKDKAAETFKDAVKAVINTFDGFTYTLQVAKKSVDGGDKWFVTVATTAKFADKRDTSKDAKDEKEEDKKKKDEQFAADKKALEEKLAKEKACDGWVYEVTEYTVNTLLKKRSEIVKVEEKKEEEKPAVPGITPNTPIPGIPSAPPAAAPSTATPPPAATTKPITVTTPPIAVPPAPEMPKTTNPTAEALKDKPATPPAAPKVELKPAPEAPKAAEPKK